MYTPIFKKNQLTLGNGAVVIVTGWTPQEQVSKRLETSEYAAIGNLYSAAMGLNFLVRNLLYNPQVKAIILLGLTKADENSGSCRCFVDFFLHGFTDVGDKWKVNSKYTGFIDKDIPHQDLANFQKRYKDKVYFYTRSLHDAIDVSKSISKYAKFIEPDITERKEYYYQQPETLTTPAEIIGQRVIGETIAEAWLQILQRIRQNGVLRPTGYDGQWQELIDLVAIVKNEPEDFYFPEPNYLPVNQEFIQNYLPQMCEDSEYLPGVKYKYGQRMRSWFGVDQIQEVIDKLINEIDSASAVINLWDSGGNKLRRADCSSDHKHSGSPCLNHIWVRVIDGRLTLTATFRSNDMFSAWVSNAMGLRHLQSSICKAIRDNSEHNIKMGELVTISQSAHIYDNCFDFADKVLDQQYSEKQDYKDAVGNFVIEVLERSILVVQSTDKFINEFRGKSALKLIQRICYKNPTIEPEHIGYLGIELNKAEQCLKSNAVYHQDR